MSSCEGLLLSDGKDAFFLSLLCALGTEMGGVDVLEVQSCVGGVLFTLVG
jgi:hypothetical protein